jgi:hypothetical protein
MEMKRLLLMLPIVALGFMPADGHALTDADFMGTWEGEYTSTTFGGSQFNLTLDLQNNGFYTDSSGHLMPPYYYPDTQNWEFDAATNRLHFWYLDTVYAGQYFYQHFYYEIVSYTGNTVEMHYNFWDDPEPHPQAGTIVLSRSGVADAPEDRLPRVATLGKNYPNPFNPSTTIAFTMPREGHVSLKVFDVRGREIATLVDGTLPEGEHRHQWNAGGVSDGVYLYQLRVGDTVETRKMTLVK